MFASSWIQLATGLASWKEFVHAQRREILSREFTEESGLTGAEDSTSFYTF